MYSTSGIIRDSMNIVSIPVKISDAAIILISIKHYKIHKVANFEVSPNPEVAMHFFLSNWHPLKVCPHCIRSDRASLSVPSGEFAVKARSRDNSKDYNIKECCAYLR